MYAQSLSGQGEPDLATLVKNRGVARDFTDLAWACRSTTVEEPFQAIHYAIFVAEKVNITATSRATLAGARFWKATYTRKSVKGSIAPHAGR